MSKKEYEALDALFEAVEKEIPVHSMGDRTHSALARAHEVISDHKERERRKMTRREHIMLDRHPESGDT